MIKWGSRAILFSGNRQEVNSTWYPEIEEPIKSREKHYSLVLYILKVYIVYIAYIFHSNVITQYSFNEIEWSSRELHGIILTP